jgi:catechol 2,3-dioxygenase-like lactoylglutathione lyase family enzyme
MGRDDTFNVFRDKDCGEAGVQACPPQNALCKKRKEEQMRVGSIVIHCFEFDRMVKFWQDALHYVLRNPATGDWAVLCDPKGRGPNLSFQKREKRAERRSWIHLDLYTNRQEREVERLIRLGAKKYPWRYGPHADYVVLEDPDGNLFCVVQVEQEE